MRIVFLAAAAIVIFVQASHTACTNKKTLHLLAFLPLETEGENCLNLGEELIPAAEIAAQRINNNSELLANFNIEIIPAKTDDCSDPSYVESLTSFVKYVSDSELNIVGIIGLVCPSSLLSLSPLASLQTIGLTQITSSTASPGVVTARNKSFDKIYQTAPSSIDFNKAIIALMESNSWNTISVIRHTESVDVEHDYIANDFQRRIEKRDGFSISLFAETLAGLHRSISKVRSTGIRIVYLTVIDSEARDLLCDAYLHKVSWPNYVFILHDHPLENLLLNTSVCSAEMMQEALEGVILLYHEVIEDDEREIDFANYTYREYLDLYNKSLRNITSNPTCNKSPGILRANALHDSVIAFAYALNKSLLETEISCFEKRGGYITKTIDSSLFQSMNFSGAGGEISFDNITHEQIANHGVDIYQIFRGKLHYLAHYDGFLTYNAMTLSDISFTFESRIIQLPLVVSILTFVLVGFCTVLTAIILILFIHYRNTPDIKATSPLFSYIILFLCFLLYISVVLTAGRDGFAAGKPYAMTCISEQWFSAIGIQLIFATLFVRLLRVFRIFFWYKPIGVLWSDKVLILFIFAIVSVSIFLLILWSIVDGLSIDEKVDFVADGNPPHYTVDLRCVAEKDPVFVSLVFGYAMVFMVLVLILAIKTRKVTIDSFKDTKSVNMFIFCSIIVLSLFIPLSFITAESDGVSGLTISYTFHVVPLMTVAIACISLLFIPKIYFACFMKKSRNDSTTLNTVKFTRASVMH